MKKIYYLVSLPRAGNTLFGSLLNQNPRIKVTANSIVPDIIFNTECLKREDIFRNFSDEKSLDNVLKNIISNYYKDWDCDIVLDRSVWGLSGNLELLKKYSPNEIKFVVLYRDVQEVVASFIHWSENNKPNYLDDATDGSIGSKVNYILRDDSDLWRHYESIVGARDSGYPCFFMKYQDLVNRTSKTLSSLYNFLDLESFQHNLNELDKFNVYGVEYDDDVCGSNLHTIRRDGLYLSDYDINRYISDDKQKNCLTLNFWKDNHTQTTKDKTT